MDTIELAALRKKLMTGSKSSPTTLAQRMQAAKDLKDETPDIVNLKGVKDKLIMHWVANGVNLQDDTDSEAETLKKSAIPKELFMTWVALDKADKLEEIKQKNPTLYYVLFYEEYGELPTGSMYEIDPYAEAIYTNALQEFKAKTLSSMTYEQLEENRLLSEFRKKYPVEYERMFKKKFGVSTTNITPVRLGVDLSDEVVDTKNKALPEEVFKSWDELEATDQLEVLKEKNPSLLYVLFSEKFGKPPAKYAGIINAELVAQYEDARTDYKIRELLKMDYDELLMAGKLRELEAYDTTLYKQKYFAKYGTMTR